MTFEGRGRDPQPFGRPAEQLTEGRHHQEADGPAADKDAAGKVSYRAAAIASGGGSMCQKMEKEHVRFEFQSRN